MATSAFRLIALAAALLHLADPLLSCAVHSHGAVPAQHGHPHDGQHRCSHHLPAAPAPNQAQDESKHSDCPDDCAICRHLAQPVLAAAVTPPQLQWDFVGGIAEPHSIRSGFSRPLAYQSRGPPLASA